MTVGPDHGRPEEHLAQPAQARDDSSQAFSQCCVQYLFGTAENGLSHLDEQTYVAQAFTPYRVRHGQGPEVAPEPHPQDFLARWPEECFPLKVYSTPQYGVLYNPMELKQLSQLVFKATGVLQTMASEQWQFVPHATASGADIIMTFTRQDTTTLSHCVPKLGSHSQIMQAAITIHTGASVLNNPLAHKFILHQLLHNLLHAMGLWGHSNNPLDIGHSQWHPHQLGLSARDRETLALLYRCPLGLTRAQLQQLLQHHQQYRQASIPSFTLEDLLKLGNSVVPASPSAAAALSSQLSNREQQLQQIFAQWLAARPSA